MGIFNKGHIDTSTGRNKRDKSPVRHSGMRRRNGKVIDRAGQRRAQRTGEPYQEKGPWAW